MPGDGVGIALAETGIDLLHGREAVNVPHLRETVARGGQEGFLSLAGGLDGHAAAGDLPQLGLAAALADHHPLAAVQIGPGPGVVRLPPGHGEAAPDAVGLAAFQDPLLVLPGHGNKLRLHSQSAAGLPGQVHVHAGAVAVVIDVIIG